MSEQTEVKKRGRKPANVDMARIKELFDAGKTPGQIAKEMGVSRFLVRDRLEKLKEAA